MKAILKLKTWILFLIFFLPFVLGFNRIILMSVPVWLFWIYSIVINGQNLIEQLGLSKKNLNHFKFNFFIVATWVAILIISALANSNYLNSNNELNWQFFLELPISLYFPYAFMQIFYVASITVTKLELKREVSFWNDAISHFIRLIGYPLGVLGVHPIIRKAILSAELAETQNNL
jgi:hypothetical protein